MNLFHWARPSTKPVYPRALAQPVSVDRQGKDLLTSLLPLWTETNLYNESLLSVLLKQFLPIHRPKEQSHHLVRSGLMQWAQGDEDYRTNSVRSPGPES